MQIITQIINSDEPSVEDDYIEDIVIKPSSNYRVDEDRDPNYYKMIHHIDDLPTLIDNFLVYRCVLMLKQVFYDSTACLEVKQDIMHLIFNSDDLNSLFFFQMKTAGYEPAITFECGRITHIRLELKRLLCVMRTQ